MTDCILCNVDKGVVFEDDKCKAILPPTPAVPGHIILFPKEHFQIIEQVPDFLVAHMFNIANKLSIASFECVQAQGSNILINNGVAAGQLIPHFSIHIIPRSEKDSLNFDWNPKQMNQEQMSTIELKIKKAAKDIGGFELKEKKAPIKLEDKAPKKIKSSDKGENYLLKQINRIP